MTSTTKTRRTLRLINAMLRLPTSEQVMAAADAANRLMSDERWTPQAQADSDQAMTAWFASQYAKMEWKKRI